MPDAKNLIQIRCTNKIWYFKENQLKPCGHLCAEVFAGSSGRALCSACRKYTSKVKNSGINPVFWYDTSDVVAKK